MFDNHKIIEIDGEEILYLYYNTSKFNYELGYFSKQKRNKIVTTDEVNDYLKKHKVKFSGKKIFLVANGIIISSLFLTTIIAVDNHPTNSDNNIEIESEIEYEIESDDIIVTVIRSNGEILEIELESYLVGVVAAEMPALFTMAALKAQAIASRTFALKRISIGAVLTDTTSTQVYKDDSQLKEMWGDSFEIHHQRIQTAVFETKGQYLAYQGQYIDALFHSTSNGRTEDPIYVWGGQFPYLRSVPSPFDKDAPNFYGEVTKAISDVNSILGVNITSQDDFLVLSRTANGSIDRISIAGKIFTGRQVREKLSLRSTDFSPTIVDSNIIFKTRGHGHGVGMSQRGAEGMGRHGYSYQEILFHFYSGVDLLRL